MYKIIGVFLILGLVLACADDPSPKPYGQIRIDMPENHVYKRFDDPACPYSIEVSSYSGLIERKESCWYNIYYPAYDATIHLTYRSINGNLPDVINDARSLIMKHSVKADGVQEQMFVNDSSKVYGTLVHVLGNAANSLQFYVTDSTDHFLRAALYFNTAPNRDSLSPVINWIQEDMRYMMESVAWRP